MDWYGKVMDIKQVLLLIHKRVTRMLSVFGIGKFYYVKTLNKRILSYFKSDFAEVQGHKMFLDSEDSLRLSINGVYEPFETELVKRGIKKGDVVVDIGANIGYYTLIFSKLVSEQGNVFAFEPDPTNFALLGKNVEINGYENVVLVQKAVSNATGKLKLYLCESNKADHRIYNSDDGRQSIDIESVRLGNYFQDYDEKIDFIKMDIQGAEAGALRGMTTLLERNKNVTIVTEFWPIGLKRFGSIELSSFVQVKHSGCVRGVVYGF